MIHYKKNYSIMIFKHFMQKEQKYTLWSNYRLDNCTTENQ